MMLPLPTVSGVDTTREKLKEAEARPAVDIAGAARGAMAVADAASTMNAKRTADEEARWFQTEYVDKGWDGYQKLWQEAGSPPEADPRFLRQAVGDTPTKAFEFLGKVKQRAAASEATKKYKDALASGTATEDELAALAIAAGEASGEGLESINKERERKEKSALEDKKITATATEKNLDRELDRELKRMDVSARAAKAGATPTVQAQIDKDVAERKRLLQQESDLLNEKNPKRRDNATLNHVRTQLRAINASLRSAGMKGLDVPADGAPPPATDKPLTRDEALQYLEKAGGDKNKARELAKKDGRSF